MMLGKWNGSGSPLVIAEIGSLYTGGPSLGESTVSTVSTCEPCKAEPLAPVSCNSAYATYLTDFNDRFINANTSAADVLIINSDYKLTETAFCEGQFAYIIDAYIKYLNDFNVSTLTGATTNYLSLAQFGSTPLGYSDAKLSMAVDSYSDYLLTHAISWNSYMNTIYMGLAENRNLCPSTMPHVPTPKVTLPKIPCNLMEVNTANVTIQTQTEIVSNQLVTEFEKKYLETGMSSLTESFTEQHADEEYHYTLYSYDRAGNLIQTVPPKGVQRMEYDNNGNPIPTTNSYTTADIATARNNFNLYQEGSATTPAPVHTLKTIYRYNSLNQLVYQNTPDGGESRFGYDGLGRLVVSQNAKQEDHQPSETRTFFSYTEYDYLGRVIEVGEITSKNLTGTLTINDEGKLMQGTTAYNVDYKGWTNIFSKREVTRTFYDGLTGITVPVNSASNTSIESQFGSSYRSMNTRNRILGVIYQSVYNTDLSVYDNGTFYDYDVHGNVVHMIQVNNDEILVGLSHNIKHVEYEYDLVSGNVNKVIYQRGLIDQFIHRYQYDADNRITIAETSSDNIHYEKDAKYFYYDHGPLARTELGNSKVQAEDYAYTIQGWLKSVNGEELNPTTMMGQDGAFPSTGSGSTITINPNKNVARDAFGYSLNYFSGDYVSAGTHDIVNNDVTVKANQMLNFSLTASNLGNDLYNGNIRTMHTVISDLTENTANGYTHQTNYKYDQLNRIKAMDGFKAITPGTTSLTSYYNSSYSYDANGNLTGMNNNISDVDASGTGTLMDNFSYNYLRKDGSVYDPLTAIDNPSITTDDFTNRLSHVLDNAPSSNFVVDIDNQNPNNYEYDQIGQLTRDISEGIIDIEWTVTNKVKRVRYGTINGTTKIYNGREIMFDYDAMGHRIAKHLTEEVGGSIKSTYYVLDAQGNAMSTYEFNTEDGSTKNKLYLSDRNIYGSKRVGIEEVNTEVAEYLSSTSCSNADILIVQNSIAQILGQIATINLELQNPNLSNSERTYKLSLISRLNDILLEFEDQLVNLQYTYNLCVQTQSSTGLNSPSQTEVLNTGHYVNSTGDKRYELTNHLGNVLNVITDRKLAMNTTADPTHVAYFTADVVSYSDYLPFGQVMPNRHHDDNQYKYGFQGQEKDDEIKGNNNSVNYTLRMHDPRIGRFFSIDPKASNYPFYSPYAFSGNRVIDAFEQEGAQPADYKMRQSYIEYFKEENGGITQSMNDEIHKSAKERGFYLQSDVPILSNLPGGKNQPSSWSLAIKKSKNDLGILVVQDRHYVDYKKAGNKRNLLPSDAPSGQNIAIPESNLTAILTAQKGNGIAYTQVLSAQASGNGVLNSDMMSNVETNFQSEILKAQRSSIKANNQIIDIKDNYRLRAELNVNENTPEEKIQQMVSDIKDIGERSGFNRNDVNVNVNKVSNSSKESVKLQTNSSDIIIPEGK